MTESETKRKTFRSNARGADTYRCVRRERLKAAGLRVANKTTFQERIEQSLRSYLDGVMRRRLMRGHPQFYGMFTPRVGPGRRSVLSLHRKIAQNLVQSERRRQAGRHAW